MTDEQLYNLAADAEQLARLHGHHLMPWTYSPFKGVGAQTECVACGRGVHVGESGMSGTALDEDCPKPA